jgi:probable phosphoglycerate mutase
MQAENQYKQQVHHFSKEKQNGPEVWLIRHGESEAHAGLAAAHTRDIPLTEAGRQQADKIAQELEREPNLIITSPYRRAYETATPTLQRFAHVSSETWPVEEFTYLGSLAGISSTKYERRSRVDAYWEQCDPTSQDGSAESFIQFLSRVRESIERLKNMQGLIAVFTHEQFIRAAEGLLDGSMGETPRQMARFRQLLLTSPLPYGCIKELRLSQTRECLPQREYISPRALLTSIEVPLGNEPDFLHSLKKLKGFLALQPLLE